jgi:hypothetical protein
MPHFKDDSCYAASGKYCACIEFHLSEDKRRGFHTSHLIEYTLEPNPDAADDKDIPPQRLALVFSTADVEVVIVKLQDRNRPAEPCGVCGASGSCTGRSNLRNA